VGSRRLAIATSRLSPSAKLKTSAATTYLISGLYHTACPLAVYASPRALLLRDARLASGWRPPLAALD